jgi:methylated-DNA-[protein]-cysteine S-methyltransferase
MTAIGIEMESPLGPITLLSEAGKLCGVLLAAQNPPAFADGSAEPVLTRAKGQLDEWFAGERTSFDLPMAFSGTHFQCRVWQALTRIEFGQTCSYGELATRVGQRSAVRAVGAANGKNRLGIVVPCHRVIGANGTLTGYAGGLEAKAWLLRHEATVLEARYPDKKLPASQLALLR